MNDISEERKHREEPQRKPDSLKMTGHPIQIVTTQDDHTFVLDEDALSEILMKDNIRDKHVVIVSIAGAFRKGKSFLLDFLLRFMNNMSSSDWLGDADTPLTGFSWRGGCERDTTGILIWSEVFTVKRPSGEEVAVLLMDTQGAFDSESTVKDNATVFALSTMLSSVQVFNLSQNIQEDDLQHLQLFTEYGRLALEDTCQVPFQKLLFLVRDWSFPYEAEYGIAGGDRILDRRLTISERQHKELQQLRRHIRSCFSSIDCFLMPHPGLNVATNPNFTGKLKDIEQEFVRQLQVLVPLLLAPENLILKNINGQNICCRDLLFYFKAYMKMYTGNSLPEPKSMLQATAEANNLTAVSKSKDMYMELMEQVCGGDKPYLNTQTLESLHLQKRDQAIESFKKSRKMGGEEFSQAYEKELHDELDDMYHSYVKNNESKNIFKAFKTPAVLFTIVILMYILSGTFGFLGLYPFANMFNLIMGVALLTFVFWSYVRYTGTLRQIGTQIDTGTLVVWDTILKPVYVKFFKSYVTQATQQVATRSMNGNVKSS